MEAVPTIASFFLNVGSFIYLPVEIFTLLVSCPGNNFHKRTYEFVIAGPARTVAGEHTDEAISLFTIKAACYTAWDCFSLCSRPEESRIHPEEVPLRGNDYTQMHQYYMNSWDTTLD